MDSRCWKCIPTLITKEKLYIVGGPEFEELQGHVLAMHKALYGTRSGGSCWHDKLFDILHQIGFKPSKAEPSKADPVIWMKSSKDGNHYEYNAVYVDDLAICMKDPKAFCDTLKEKYKLKLEGVGPIKILESYEKMPGSKPKKTRTPLIAGDQPENDYQNFVTKTKSNNIKKLFDS